MALKASKSSKIINGITRYKKILTTIDSIEVITEDKISFPVKIYCNPKLIIKDKETVINVAKTKSK